jgi:hypothetical protein
MAAGPCGRTDDSWIHDIKGGLSIEAILDYLHLWDIFFEVNLTPSPEYHHLWVPSSSGNFSKRSAYRRFSMRVLILSLGRKYGKLGLHLVENFHLVGLTKSMLDC